MKSKRFFEGLRFDITSLIRNSSFVIRHFSFFILHSSFFFLLSGCVAFDPTFTNSFLDDEGNVVSVVHGRLSEDHVTQIESPGNGRLVDYKSKEAVKITLPDGQVFTAYQTLNTLRIGNMYKTDDDGLIYVTNGLMCRIYAMLEDGSDHLLIFEGNLTKTPETTK